MKAVVEAHSQKSGSGSKVALANGCMSKPIVRPVELTAFAAMTLRNSSRARRTARGLASSRRLWRMQVPSCASNCTSSFGHAAPSTCPATSLVLRKSLTIRSISCRPAEASVASSQLEACDAMPITVSRWVTRRFSGAPLSMGGFSPGSWVWKCTTSSGLACSSSSCTHATANAFVGLVAARNTISRPPAAAGAASAVIPAPSSSPPSAPSSAVFAAGGAPPPALLGGRASTICLRACSHIESCSRPRCFTRAFISPSSAAASGPWASSRRRKR
mmetsp:Transcript_102971/g.222311  ORF Transcript_102971/g.222311 Transcript_102971/m.222311 type:complete len:274 (+) Transcript_102971:1071-1892(+)